jgi:hypothetical protein
MRRAMGGPAGGPVISLERGPPHGSSPTPSKQTRSHLHRAALHVSGAFTPRLVSRVRIAVRLLASVGAVAIEAWDGAGSGSISRVVRRGKAIAAVSAPRAAATKITQKAAPTAPPISRMLSTRRDARPSSSSLRQLLEGQLGRVLRSEERAARSAADRKAAESGDIHSGLVSTRENRHPSDVRTTSKW